MRNPRPENFDPKHKSRQPDAINMDGIVPLQPKEAVIETSNPLPPQEESDGVVSRHRDTTIPPVSEVPMLNSESAVIERVRKAVKEFGKEAATHRFTLAEKKAIAELVYTYRQQGLRTNENVIARIAINYLFFDYQRNLQKSILHKALQSLNQ